MFSVIIPACNEEKYIEATLKSIPKELETIVVCNGCYDKTEEIARIYTSNIIVEKEANVSKARNLGALIAKNPYLIFLDADTLMHGTDLKKIQQSLNKGVIGVCKVKPDIKKLKAKLFMSIKNQLLFTKWNTGLHFCKKDVWEKVKYNESLKKKELKEFFNGCSKYGKFVIADTYAISSMRRFEQYGYFKTTFYWIKQYLKEDKKDYPLIR